MDRIPSSLLLPLMAGIFVLVIGGGLGVIFTLAGIMGTIIIGLAIVVLSPIIAFWLAKGQRTSP